MSKKTNCQKKSRVLFLSGLSWLFAASMLLIGCTDSSPSIPTVESSGDVQSADSGDLGDLGNSSNSQIYSSANTPWTSASSSQSSANLPFDVSTLPGVYTPSGELNYNVSGIAAFAPFKTGATVSVYGLDATSMKVSPSAVNSAVSSDKGEFSSTGTITSNYANIVVSGSYYNLITQEYSPITLNAVMDMQGRSSANVNVLTRLAYDRTVYLVAKDSVPFAKAKAQAEKEVLEALGLIYDETPFENINMNTVDQAGANLIIATIMLMLEDNPADAASNIAAIAADMAADGTWDDANLKTKIADALLLQDKFSVTNQLKKVTGNSSITVKNLGPFRFWGFQYGLGECTEENDGATAICTNAQSKKNGKTFLCQDSSWKEVSAAILYSNEVAAVLGECNSSNGGATGKYKEDDVICKNGYWQKMSEEELVNAMVTQEKGECSSANNLTVVNIESTYYQCNSSMWRKLDKTPVDYSAGRAMNKKLGRGINFGNSWDAPGTGSSDGSWSNPIQDGWFKVAKDAGFNSIRLPVRWEDDASDGNISDARMNAVKADVDLAINQGLTVIVNAHHHDKLNSAASTGSNYSGEKTKFLKMWKQIAQKFSSYSSNVVLEIMNEPHDIDMSRVNDLMISAYDTIRHYAPNSTIMFEATGYSKFAQIPNLNLPNDGNIIVSGHYYDPYTFTHQGHNDYTCNAQASFSSTTIESDFESYASSIAAAFPDIKGGYVPVNMGEFGVSITNCGGSGLSDAKRAQWTEAVIAAAERQGMSWHYWAFAGAGGFEAYNKHNSSWYSDIKAVFDTYLKKASAVK